MARYNNDKKERKILVKIVCVIASFILWLYVANTENPEIPKNISVPVEIENIKSLSDSKLVLLKKSQYYTTIKVKGPVLEVNKLKASDFKLKADLSLYALKKGINYIPIEVVDQPNNVVITEPRSVTVKVNIDELVEKSVPVKVDIPVKLKEGYKALDPVPKQTSVYVSGPSQYVKNVDYVSAKMAAQTDADKDLELNVSLKAYDAADRVIKNVEISPKNVDVVIPVRKVKIVPINIKTKGNINSSVELKSITSKPTQIAIYGSDKDISNVNSIDTEPVDLSTIDGNKNLYVKLKLPNNINTVSSQSTVKIILNVSSIQQKNITANIKFKNLGKGYQYKSNMSSISLVLLGSESVINNISKNDIKCTVDLRNLKEGSHTIPVNVSVPNGITVSSYTPKKVKVTITKTTTDNNKTADNNQNTDNAQ